jgi:hypothetical protein
VGGFLIVGFGLGLLAGEFLVAEFSVEGGVGELAGVEDFAGAFGVDGVVGESLGDLAGDLEDGVAVGEGGQGEAAVGVEEDGRGADAVAGAEVLALDGGLGAAGVVGDVLEALVEVVGALDVGLDLVHGGYPPPRFLGWIVEIWVETGKARLVAGPSLFALLFNFTGWDETHLPSKCGGYVAGGAWVGELSTGLGA